MYSIQFVPAAKDDLQRLHKPIAQRILNKIRWLVTNFDHLPLEPLVGQWEGAYKLRVGDYRIIYTFDKSEATITIHVVRHRREVYKN